jgi:serine/threonine protein phosphatase PrpC
MADNYFGITDKGKLRENNEDAFIAEQLSNKLIAACVIDGVGGYEGGEVAAAIARTTILDYIKKPGPDLNKGMVEAFALANEKIYKEKSNGKNKSMACVLTFALVDNNNNKLLYAHVGDTRLYLLRDNTLVKVTKDQSFVGFLEDSGRITEDAAMAHPKRNEINKALGFAGQAPVNNDYVETGESPFLPGDMILLCSDGLTDMVGSKEITNILIDNTTLKEKGVQLIAAANKAGGKDNITTVLVHNNKAPIKQKATKPIALKKNANPESKTSEPGQVIELPSLLKQTTNRGGLIMLLSTLCIALLGALLWVWWQGKEEKKPLSQNVATLPNALETKLQDAINNASSDTLVLNDSIYGSAIALTDTIHVDRDTLYIKGANTRFIRDNSFVNGGPALIFSENCKQIILDSLSFQDFDIALAVANRQSVQLKNIGFNNCRISLGYLFSERDSSSVNGSFQYSQIPLRDSNN